MKYLSISTCALVLSASALLAAPPKKPSPKKPPVKPAPSKPAQPGVKGAAQLAGGALRFGDLFALKSGFTYQILSAAYSLEPYECYATTGAATGNKFLVLTIAIKNNRRGEDNFFGEHPLQAVDSQGRNYESGYYRLRSKPRESFGPNLKPGQGLGQGAIDPVEVVFEMPLDAKVAKIVLKTGREGTSEEVLRFFIAGASEAEAGGKPDPKNVISPLPAWAEKGALVAAGQYVPTWTYHFKLDGFSAADKKGSEDAPEGKRWIFASVTVKNPMHDKQSLFDFTGGDEIREMILIDADGEKHPAYEMLKAKRDEGYEGELEPGEEKSYRIAFLVPKDAIFKSVRIGAPRGNRFLFDASAAGK